LEKCLIIYKRGKVLVNRKGNVGKAVCKTVGSFLKQTFYLPTPASPSRVPTLLTNSSNYTAAVLALLVTIGLPRKFSISLLFGPFFLLLRTVSSINFVLAAASSVACLELIKHFSLSASLIIFLYQFAFSHYWQFAVC